ncbi:Hypothetical predicted protein [Mytilus galloprovincialis]|uniref:Farnesoic acid O-methyl transferase domain-containing protein n=1 Tax=Mytilus galloprovincialis TaxID=29158 RepID=A0A8B6DH66_MYTGA|nr:Hypothetical predicted protein [Mytilus galloprovincialis]
MTFEVKACGEASIVMLNSEVGDPKKPMLNLIIGGENNTKSAIKRQLDDSLTGTSQRGVFYPTPGYVVDVNKYGLDLTGITTLTFEVMACGEASIVMSNSEVGDPKKPMYDFIIGGENNQKSFLRRRKDDSLTARSKQTVFYHTPDVCKCDEYRPFWIRAIDGDLWIGEGRIVGMNVTAEFYYPPPFTVRAIGIYTNQENVGEWKVQLEVLHKLFDGSFLQCSTNYKAVLDIILSKKTSLLQCAIMCDMLLSCIGHNYHYQSCELLAFSPGHGVVTKIPKKQEDGWEFYTKCYRYNRACLWCYF